MPYLFHKLANQKTTRTIQSLIFFILFYLYLWLAVDTRFISGASGEFRHFPVFYRGWAFFWEIIINPGGLTDYLSAFQAQFFYYSWAGAFVATLQAWLIYVFTATYLKAANISRFYLARFIAPIILLVLYNRYLYFLDITTALLIALIFTSLYLKITTKHRALRLAGFLIFSAILYAIAGAAYLLFAILCVIYELLIAHRRQLATAMLLLAAGITYVGGTLVFQTNIIDTFSKLLPVSPDFVYIYYGAKVIVIACAFYLFLPLTTLALLLWQRIAGTDLGRAGTGKTHSRQHNRKKAREKSTPKASVQNNKLIPILGLCLLFIIAGMATFFSRNKILKTVLETDYYSTEKMWPKLREIIDRNLDYSSVNPFQIYLANRALYHTDRLAYDLFSYPQHPMVLFMGILPTAEKVGGMCQKVDFYFDLGFMNQAEYFSSKALESVGELPSILKRLAMIKMAKGDINAARVYLGALSKTLFHDDWAKAYLAKLASDPNLTTDKQIQYLRSIRLKEDYLIYGISIEKILSDLIEENKYNKMVFEYQTVSYLLGKRLDKVIENLGRLDDFDYPETPRLFEEALLMYRTRVKKETVLDNLQISPESHQRYSGFSKTWARYRGNTGAALDELEKNYSDTYFFYYIYGPLIEPPGAVE